MVVGAESGDEAGAYVSCGAEQEDAHFGFVVEVCSRDAFCVYEVWSAVDSLVCSVDADSVVKFF